MFNKVVLVGRIEKIDFNKNSNSSVITVKINKQFKNSNKEYDYDVIPCEIKPSINNQINNLCNINDVIGIKGFIENRKDKLYVISEKISLLSSK